MQQLTPHAQKQITELAQRYQVSVEAVIVLLVALVKGNGTMAQFDHKEFGGTGQWMRGGMIMVGDMFNSALKAKVDGLCSELSTLLTTHPFQPSLHTAQSGAATQRQQQGNINSPDPSGTHSLGNVSLVFQGGGINRWWPADLGTPTTSGSQNSLRYVYFSQQQRLAVAVNGQVTIYDTGDHQISGVSQQQGLDSSLTFTSQYGVVPVARLPVISDGSSESPKETQQSVQNPSFAPSSTPIFLRQSSVWLT